MEKVLLAFAAAFAVGISAFATAWVQSRIGSAGAGALAEKPDLSDQPNPITTCVAMICSSGRVTQLAAGAVAWASAKLELLGDREGNPGRA